MKTCKFLVGPVLGKSGLEMQRCKANSKNCGRMNGAAGTPMRPGKRCWKNKQNKKKAFLHWKYLPGHMGNILSLIESEARIDTYYVLIHLNQKLWDECRLGG